MSIPHELGIGEVLLPPLLIAGIFGVIATLLTAKLLNKYRLSKYFFYPPLAMVAMMVIYTLLFGMFIISF